MNSHCAQLNPETPRTRKSAHAASLVLLIRRSRMLGGCNAGRLGGKDHTGFSAHVFDNVSKIDAIHHWPFEVRLYSWSVFFIAFPNAVALFGKGKVVDRTSVFGLVFLFDSFRSGSNRLWVMLRAKRPQGPFARG